MRARIGSWSMFQRKLSVVGAERDRLSTVTVRPAALTAQEKAELGDAISREVRAGELLRRPEFDYEAVCRLEQVGFGQPGDDLHDELREQVELQLDVEAKYHGYIERQQREIERHARQESLRLPADLDYASVHGLSNEARQRLEKARPETLGQASRLEGVTPSTVSLLLVHLKKDDYRRSA